MSETASAKPAEPSLTKRLGGATFNYGLGGVLPKVVGFLLIPLYTAFLSPSDYGVLELAGTFSSFLFIVMRLGIPGAVSRFYFEHQEGEPLRDFLTTIGWFQMGASLIVGAIALLLWPVLNLTLLPGIGLSLGLLVVLSSVLNGTTDVQRRVIQAREQSAYSATLSTVSMAIQVTCAILLVAVFRLGIYGMLLSYVVSGLILYGQALHYLAPDLKGRFRPAMLKESLAYSSAILPSQLIATFAPLATRAILAGRAGLSEVGLLATATRFASPLAILVAAFSAAYLPVYFSMRTKDDAASREALAKVTRTTWTLALFVTAGTALVGPPLIRLLTPASYHAAASLLPVVALGGLVEVVYVLVSPEIYYAKKSWMVPLVSLTTAVVTLGLTFLTAQRFGALGVSWSFACGLLASSALGAALSVSLVTIPYDWKGMAVATAACAATSSIGLFTTGLSPALQGVANSGSVVLFVACLAAVRNPVFLEVVQSLAGRRAVSSGAAEGEGR